MCNSCTSLAGLVLSFIACFILLVIAPLQETPITTTLKLAISPTRVTSTNLADPITGASQLVTRPTRCSPDFSDELTVTSRSVEHEELGCVPWRI